MPSTHLYQIFYSDETRRKLDPDFIPLDNSSNARPDWREYWPIRNFLLNNALVEGDYYAFFSPRLKDKTRLTGAQVKAFILEPEPVEPDVLAFSPMWDMSALYPNVFLQAEICDPQIRGVMPEFFQKFRPDIRLDQLVTDSRNTIFCNYFAAKPSFWRSWLKIGEELFELAERGQGALAGKLNSKSNYPEAAQQKVFVMERVATFLLATENRWKVKASNSFRFSAATTPMVEFHLEAVLADALKVAYSVHPIPEYRDAYAAIRQKIATRLDILRAAAKLPPGDNP